MLAAVRSIAQNRITKMEEETEKMKTKILGGILIGYGVDTGSIAWCALGITLILLSAIGAKLEGLPR